MKMRHNTFHRPQSCSRQFGACRPRFSFEAAPSIVACVSIMGTEVSLSLIAVHTISFIGALVMDIHFAHSFSDRCDTVLFTVERSSRSCSRQYGSCAPRCLEWSIACAACLHFEHGPRSRRASTTQIRTASSIATVFAIVDSSLSALMVVSSFASTCQLASEDRQK